MPQPTFSIAAPPDGAEVAPAELAAIGAHIAAQGVFGLVWLDRDLTVRTRFGPLVAFIADGAPVTDSVPPLIGLEDDIHALSASPDRLLELPAVAIVRADGAMPRLNFTIFWLAGAERFLVLVYRASSRSDIEIELTRQVRGRLIAEAEVQAKSRALARANAELGIANRDLEQYAAIISHDLKAPLRALRYLGDDAEAAIGEGRIEATRAAITEMRTQARRMSRMMSALLDYASVGRKSEAVALVDTRALIAAIAASLPHPPEMTIEIEGDWPEVLTLEAPLDLVLRNLLDNALKHHDRPDGRVRVSARDLGASLELTVADDGPGIPAEARETIFLPFRTLGSGSGGTGMGLALVRRTLDAVGGSIGIATGDGDQQGPRRGTTFAVVWPKIISDGA